MIEGYIEEDYILKVARNAETGLPHAMVVRLNGKLHSPPDDRPAKVLFDEQGRVKEMWWFEQDRPRRKTGPAIMQINPENGVVHYEEWRGDSGKLHRSPSEPAWTARNPETGEVLYSRYFINGEEVSPPFKPKQTLDLKP